METPINKVDNYDWRLTYEAIPSTSIPPLVDFEFTLKKTNRVKCQHTTGIISKIIEYPRETSTLSSQFSHIVIEDPVSLELEIMEALIQFSILDDTLWSKIFHAIIGFVHELLDNYGAASALAIDLELLIENTVGEDETCAICLDGLCDRVGLARAPCEHVFHYSCLMSWLPLNNSCPLCRRQVYMNVDDDDDDDDVESLV